MKNFQKMLVPVALLMCGVAYAQFPSVLKLVKSVIIPDSNIVFSVSNKAPKTDAEWAAVLKSAEKLVAGAQQLMPMGPDTGREPWVQFTQSLGASARKAAAAAKARNADAVVAAGDEMFEVCENCHRMYMKK